MRHLHRKMLSCGNLLRLSAPNGRAECWLKILVLREQAGRWAEAELVEPVEAAAGAWITHAPSAMPAVAEHQVRRRVLVPLPSRGGGRPTPRPGTGGAAVGISAGAGLCYLGGGADLGIGLYNGLDGSGIYLTGDLTTGIGGFLGAGVNVTGYSSLEAFGGTSYGAKVEGPGVEVGVWGNEHGSGVTGSLGPQVGAWVGPTVSHTLLIPLDPIAYMKTIVPSN